MVGNFKGLCIERGKKDKKVFLLLLHVGPSGVPALPLAAGRKVGGHYKGHFFLFFFLLLSSGSLLILPEGVAVGF